MLTFVRVTLRLLTAISGPLAGRVAWLLFGRTIRAKVRMAERGAHAQAKTETVVINGRTIVVYQWGDGREPVLMLHGWGGRGSNFAGFVPGLLGHGLTPVTFDAPAHGDSEGSSTEILECAQIIRRIQERYGPFRAIIAHSFGTLAAFHAVRGGTVVGRIVTINGVCAIGYLVDSFCSRLALSSGVRQDIRRRMENYFAPETDIWRKFSVSYEPAAVDVPILVIQDYSDSIVDPGQALQIVAAHGSRAKLMTTHGWGHRKAMTAPAVIESAIEFVTDGQAG